MQMGKKTALLTAGHLSSCPRLIKEASILSSNGYEVSIVYLESIPRISVLDKHIISENPNWNFYSIQWENDIDSLISKIYFRVSSLFKLDNIYIQSTSKSLIDKTLSIKADLYIAHHPSVLIAAALAAKKYNAQYAYDIEDAFPYVNENSYFDNPNQQILDVEKRYINDTAFTTTASPLYSEVYIKNYKLLDRPIDLMNVFDINNDPIEYKDRVDLKKVSFYWYSQTVGLNRGLQDLFSAINYLPDHSFELHIRGTCTLEVKNILLDLVTNHNHYVNIIFHDSIPMSELELRNKEHDLGFALEYSNGLNKDLCISNKILDYLRSGLMIVATNTSGHKLIANDLNNDCITYDEGDIKSLGAELLNLINNKNRIVNAKAKSLELANSKYNWTIQSADFLKAVINAIH
jgi:glycosyltransferase involved in cell wall biosynthesis